MGQYDRDLCERGQNTLSSPPAKKPVSLYTVHDGAVHTVQRSPFYNDIILTIGGWNVAIWKEGIMVSCLRKGKWVEGVVSVWSFVPEEDNRSITAVLMYPCLWDAFREIENRWHSSRSIVCLLKS